VAVSIEQAQSQQQLLVEQTVLDCRLLRQKILVNQQTRALSKQRFDITRQRFLRGQVDLLKFNLAVQAENQARIASLQLLKSYWQTYYRLRSLTLFDFETGKGLGILPTE
ncbi:MAG: TolC family protein, partial [Bacteroidota bacterium]